MTCAVVTKTLGIVSFSPCGEGEHALLRVNPDVPVREALEQVSHWLQLARMLAEAAARGQGERYAWAAHCFSDMGKAVVDDLCLEGMAEQIR